MYYVYVRYRCKKMNRRNEYIHRKVLTTKVSCHLRNLIMLFCPGNEFKNAKREREKRSVELNICQEKFNFTLLRSARIIVDFGTNRTLMDLVPLFTLYKTI